jgi:hypothetical protein
MPEISLNIAQSKDYLNLKQIEHLIAGFIGVLCQNTEDPCLVRNIMGDLVNTDILWEQLHHIKEATVHIPDNSIRKGVK